MEKNSLQVQPITNLVKHINSGDIVVIFGTEKLRNGIIKQIITNLDPSIKVNDSTGFNIMGDKKIIIDEVSDDFISCGSQLLWLLNPSIFCISLESLASISPEKPEVKGVLQHLLDINPDLFPGVSNTDDKNFLDDAWSNFKFSLEFLRETYGEDMKKLFVWVKQNDNDYLTGLVMVEKELEILPHTKYHCRKCKKEVVIHHKWWKKSTETLDFLTMKSPEEFDMLCVKCSSFCCLLCGKLTVREETSINSVLKNKLYSKVFQNNNLDNPPNNGPEISCIKMPIVTIKSPVKSGFICDSCRGDKWFKVMKEIRKDILISPIFSYF